MQGGRHAGREVAADAGGAEKDDLGLLLLDEPAQNGRMGQRAERSESLVVGDPHGVGAVLGELLFDACELLAEHHGVEPDAQGRGQLAALGQQFETYVGDLALLDLDIDEYVVHNAKTI